uniref:Uncharacterized protein n=1 Tax=Arundo donax TaxID=35708 RepID=A0A0A9C4B5_ARUDO
MIHWLANFMDPFDLQLRNFLAQFCWLEMSN